MANFNAAVITNKGKALLIKSQTSSTSLIFTKIETGIGSYNGTEDLKTFTTLKDKKDQFNISNVVVVDDTTIKLRSLITNDGLLAGYYIKEIGLFALDPDEGEILYSLSTAVLNQWDYLPTHDSHSPATITLEIYSTVSNASNVTIVAGTGAVALAEDLELLQEKVNDLKTIKIADGTGTSISLSDVSFVDGYTKTFIVKANNNGSATTINGKPLYKPGTTQAPKLTAGKAITVWYSSSGDCFFINQGGDADTVGGMGADSFSKVQYLKLADGTSIINYVDNFIAPSGDVDAGTTVRIINCPDFPNGYTIDNHFVYQVFKNHGNTWRVLAFDVRTNRIHLILKIGGVFSWSEISLTSHNHNTAYAPTGFGLGGTAQGVSGSCNNLVNTGWYMGQNMADAPDTVNWFMFEVIRHNDSWIYQKAVQFTHADYPTFERNKNSGVWTPWRLVGGTLKGDLKINSANAKVELQDGAGVVKGVVRANTSGSLLISGTGNAVGIYIRPNGDTSAVGEVQVTNSGAMVVTNGTDYTTQKTRNSYFSTTVPPSMANGAICFVYE